MKKNEYLAPEVEIVEIMEQIGLLAGSGGSDTLEPDITDGPSDEDDF